MSFGIYIIWKKHIEETCTSKKVFIFYFIRFINLEKRLRSQTLIGPTLEEIGVKQLDV